MFLQVDIARSKEDIICAKGASGIEDGPKWKTISGLKNHIGYAGILAISLCGE
jgi:hypothetical protein